MAFDLSKLPQMMRRWWWLLLLLPIAGAGLGYAAGDRVTPMYSATSTMIVTSQTQSAPAQFQDVQLAQALTTTYSELVLTSPVLAPVAAANASQVSEKELREATKVGVSGETLLNVSVASDDPALAAKLANDIAAEFSRYATSISTTGGVVTVTNMATVPDEPYAPRVPAYAVLGGVLGLLAASVTMFATDHLDTRHRSLRPMHNLRPLTVVPRIPRRARVESPMFVRVDPYGRTASSIRALRAAILGAHADRDASSERGQGQIVGLFSPERKTGQSLVVANLALSLAKSGVSVVVVDLNFANPRIGEFFRINGRHGVSDLLGSATGTSTNTSWSRDLTYEVNPHLNLLLTGSTVNCSVDALANPHLARVVKQIAESTDVVLLDLPASNVAPELTLVARYVDTAILVAREGRTLNQALTSLAQDLEAVGIDVLGVATTFGTRRERMAAGQVSASDHAPRSIQASRPMAISRTGEMVRDERRFA